MCGGPPSRGESRADQQLSLAHSMCMPTGKMSYEDVYRDSASRLANSKPGDVLSVVLNEEVIVASKLQLCARLPAHTDVPPYETRRDLDEEYDRRTANDEFKRIERIGLLGHLPKFSARGLHHPFVNPDIRLRLITAADNPWTPFEVQGLSQTDDPADLDVTLGPELEVFDWMSAVGDDAAEAMIWYVGRAIDRDTVPYEDTSGFSDFGLRVYLFGQIAIFLRDWKDDSPELSFTEFEKLDGDVHDGYRIRGVFEAEPLELKDREELDIDVPVERALRDWVRATLVSFLKYATLESDGVDEEDLRAGRVEPGGVPEYSDLTPAQTGEYEDASTDDIDDWSTYNLVNRLALNVTVGATEVEFELTLHPVD